MQDKLKPEYYDQIDAVIGFAGRVDLNYDCLRSIAFELNTGLPFTEAIKDLNIVNLNAENYNITMKFANGIVYTASNVRRDLFDPSSEEYVRFFNKTAILSSKSPTTMILFSLIKPPALPLLKARTSHLNTAISPMMNSLTRMKRLAMMPSPRSNPLLPPLSPSAAHARDIHYAV